MTTKIIMTLSLGIIFTGAIYEFLLKNGRLQKDKSMEGWALKIVLLLIGLSLIAFPIVTLFKGRAGQKAALTAARRGVVKGFSDSADQVIKPLYHTGKAVVDIPQKTLTTAMNISSYHSFK